MGRPGKGVNCSNCGSYQVYVLTNGTVVCRKCGKREVKIDNNTQANNAS